MESDAGWMTGRGEDSVVTMEDLRRAHDSRVSSARRLREGWDNGADDLPFWEKDDPFGQRKRPRRQARPERRAQPERQYRRTRQEPQAWQERQGWQENQAWQERRTLQQRRVWQEWPAMPERPARQSRQAWEKPQDRQAWRERTQARPARQDGRPRHARNSRREPDWSFSEQPDWDFRAQARRDGRRGYAGEEPDMGRREARTAPKDNAAGEPLRSAPQRPRYGERQPPREARAQPNRAEKRNAHARRRSNNGLLALMALLALLSIAVVIGLNVFRIRSIDVQGEYFMSAQNIAALSGISIGENIFKADLARAKRNIESDPLLEVLSISRVFPDGIAIQVRQRVPHGAIAYMGSFVIIDENGFVLDIRDSLPAGQYPLVTGVEIQPSEKGKPLQGVDGVQQQTMYALLKALYDNKAIQYISEANLGNGGDIRLLTGEGLQINLGKPTDLDRKAQWIASSVPELRRRGYTSGVLNITGAENPVYSETGASGDAGGVELPVVAGGEAGPEGVV